MRAGIHAPHFEHAANHTGRKVVAMPHVHTPERVAGAGPSCPGAWRPGYPHAPRVAGSGGCARHGGFRGRNRGTR
ncbi:hypothetical protein ADL34_08880 [Streptomyces sp. NRRL WC-3605]|nr:hypothetical protein ADL34_08880 [Streptomyces sp. NRRL WC-3605]KUL79212.1 hypothetical protein ADL33_05370 [Streptomyces sp. NRRL WC-3604]